MLSTQELKNYVYKEIQSKLNCVSWSDLFFNEGSDNSAEGTYIFNRNDEYHILYTEKGKIRSDVVTVEEREVLWNVLDIISFRLALDFAKKNKEKSREFRRDLFAKEKQIFALFGDDFRERKEKEIEKILKENPFMGG